MRYAAEFLCCPNILLRLFSKFSHLYRAMNQMLLNLTSPYTGFTRRKVHIQAHTRRFTRSHAYLCLNCANSPLTCLTLGQWITTEAISGPQEIFKKCVRSYRFLPVIGECYCIWVGRDQKFLIGSSVQPKKSLVSTEISSAQQDKPHCGHTPRSGQEECCSSSIYHT